MACVCIAIPTHYVCFPLYIATLYLGHRRWATTYGGGWGVDHTNYEEDKHIYVPPGVCKVGVCL